MATLKKLVGSAICFLAVLTNIFGNKLDLYEGSACKMKDGRNGTCTKLPECESILNGLKKGIIPLKNLVICSFIRSTEVICCPSNPPQDPTAIIFPDDYYTINRSGERKAEEEGSACKMKGGRDGVCIKLPECESILKGLKNRTIPLKDLVICSFIRATEVICCPDKTPTIPVLSNPSRDTTFIFPADNNEISHFANTKDTIKPDPSPPVSRSGGRKAEAACVAYSKDIIKPLTFFIMDGKPAYRGEFPHMAAIGYLSLTEGETVAWDCGGTLISNRYVLTAAHCAHERRLPFIVRLGTNDLEFSDESVINAGVESVIRHPQYKASRKYHDVALIRLNVTIEFSDVIRPACLQSNPSEVEANTPVIATGWGVINFTTRAKSSMLQKVNLTTIETNSCNQSYIDNGLLRAFRSGITDGQLCTFDAERSKDACEGDSGGPIQTVVENVFTVVGIVSFRMGCASGIPGVYTRVASYVDWIESIVWT